jgi:tetratricopeptide (TPR) repeat protein
MSLVRPLDFLVGDVKTAVEADRPCTLLIGAGCSVTAGIPAAPGFVEQIREEYEHRYERAPTKAYAECMAQLDRGQRDRLIEKNIANATINLAHLAIASLVSQGCVDRMLTTNFDPLVVRACALLSQFPAVYDCAASDGIRPRQIGGQAVFYLHGQYRGPILINTPTDLERNAERVRPVVEDALERGRVLIVVGYSGENDPVFDVLAEPDEYREGVFWVSYEENAPPAHVRERLLVDGKGAYQIEGYDADGFFVALAQALEAFPPALLGRPFSHLGECLSPLPTECHLPGREDPMEIGTEARKWVQQAAAVFEKGNLGTLDAIRDNLEPERRVAEAEALVLADKHEEVAELHQRYEGELPPRLAHVFRRGYNNWGNALREQAGAKQREEADALLAQAIEKYEAALRIEPDYYFALSNLGNAISDLAKTKEGEEADRLFAQAYEKYEAAVAIKSDYHRVLNNWGIALSDQAETKEGEEADRLFAQAYEKFERAVKINPEYHQALSTWAFVLLYHGAMPHMAERAQDTFALAKEKALEAERIKPGEGAYNAACASARLGEEDECRKWLEVRLEHRTLPRRSYMEEDPDLESVRDADWFKEILAKAPE